MIATAPPSNSDPADFLPPAWKPLRFHAEQDRFKRCQARFVAVAAGRSSGKTEISRRRLVMALGLKQQFPGLYPWPEPHYFYAAPTAVQAKKIAWQPLKSLVPPSWILGKPNESELIIRTRWGSELHVVGLDQPQRIEGVEWDGGVMDESCDIKPKSFELSVLPALSERKGWCYRIGVPKRYGVGAADFKKFWDRGNDPDVPEVQSFHWPSREIVDEAILAEARAIMDSRDFAEQFEATWQSASGGVFHGFDETMNVRPCPYDPSREIVVGCDFNVDPMAWILAHDYGDRFEVFDEVWLRNTNTQATLDVLYQRYKSHRAGFHFIGDASSRQRRTSAATTDYMLIYGDPRFRELGRTVTSPKANPAVADRFAITNAMLCNGKGERRLLVDRHCHRLIEDLKVRAYKPETREPADKGDIGHPTDALGYPLCILHPIRLSTGGTAAIHLFSGA